MRFEFINLERPGTDIGLRPPADFQPCYSGKAEGLDTNGDSKPDLIRVKDADGKEVCRGTDSNNDGRIDQWDVMDQGGNLKRRARDNNGDAVADETWTYDPARPGCATIHPDRNGDGRPDGPGVDVCRHLDQAVPGTMGVPTSGGGDGGGNK